MIATPRAPFTSGMTVGSQPPLSRIRLGVRLARMTGMDVAWVTDHFLGFFPQVLWDKDFSWLASQDGTPHAYFDYQVLLGHLGARCGNLRVGVGVTESVRRHPVQLAQAFLTIAHLTKRAPILGIGAGEAENTVPYGLDFRRPVSRLADALAVIRLCLDSRGPIDHHGPFFTLEQAVMDLAPPEGKRPEIWVAAHQPRMLHLAGTYGDGWYPTVPMSPAEYESSLSVVQEAAITAGRDPAVIVPGFQHHAILASTERAALQLLDTKAIRFLALLLPGSFWTAYGYDHPFGNSYRGIVDFIPQHYAKAELEAAIAVVPVDVMAEGALVGTPRQVERALSEYCDAGLRHLVIQPIGGLVSRRDALFSVRSVISIQRRLRRRFTRRTRFAIL